MATELTQKEINALQIRIQVRIAKAKVDLSEVEDELTQLQEKCPHPNEKRQSEYDFTAHWCDDCGKNWSSRR